MSDKPILYVVTSNAVKGASGQLTGFWLSELTHPMHETEAAGHRSEIAAIRAGVAPVDADSLNMDDPVNAHYWQQTDLQQRLQAVPGLDSLNGADYSAILFTGGYGTMWDFRESLDAQRLIREVYENGGIVAAVCHGPAALVDAKLSNGEYLVSGKNVAAFTNAEEEATGGAKIVPFLLETALVEHGAKHHAAPNWAENVVVDGRLITGQNPASAKGVGVALAKALG